MSCTPLYIICISYSPVNTYVSSSVTTGISPSMLIEYFAAFSTAVNVMVTTFNLPRQILL